MKFLKRWWFKLSAIYESNIDTLMLTHKELNEMLLHDHDLLLFLSSCSAAVWQSTRGPQQMPHTQSSISPPLQTFQIFLPDDVISPQYHTALWQQIWRLQWQPRVDNTRSDTSPCHPYPPPPHCCRWRRACSTRSAGTVQIFRIKNRCYLHADARILVALADTILPLVLNNVRIRVHHD